MSVATRPFKGPELLVGYRTCPAARPAAQPDGRYDYSLDLWAVGCVLGAILFNKDPYLFYGSSNQVPTPRRPAPSRVQDQLVKIVKVLGTDGLDVRRQACRAADWLSRDIWTSTTSSSTQPSTT